MRNERQMRTASNALHYEIWMLYSLPEILGSASSQDTLQYRAALESFCLHFRNLAEFFSLPRGKSDKVIAKHFISGWDVRPAAALLEKYRRRLNQEITHLTHKRLGDAEGSTWIFPQMVRALKPIVDKFVLLIPEPFKGSRWQHAPQPVPLDGLRWTSATTTH